MLCDPTGAGANISSERVPEPRSGRGRRLHLDLYARDRELEVERLLSLGARRHPLRYRPDADFVVLADPDGNLFCLVKKQHRACTGARFTQIARAHQRINATRAAAARTATSARSRPGWRRRGRSFLLAILTRLSEPSPVDGLPWCS